jgi:hypothetical protein
MWYIAIVLCLVILYATARIINHYHAPSLTHQMQDTRQSTQQENRQSSATDLADFQSDIAPSNLAEPPTYGALFAPLHQDLKQVLFSAGDVRYDPSIN